MTMKYGSAFLRNTTLSRPTDMANMTQIKEAVCQAIERRYKSVEGAKSVRMDIKFNEDGSLHKIVMFAEYDFTVRGSRPNISQYEMNS